MSKEIYFGNELRKGILEGALTFAKTVTKTYGPRSGTVMMNRMGGLLQTKDGVTVAREIHLKNPMQDMGCQVLKEACIQVNDEVGDGTTTTACLASSLIQEAHKLVVAGFCPMQLSREMKAAGDKAIDILQQFAMPVENEQELYRVALISCNGDVEVAEALTEASLAVGKNGTVAIEDGTALGIEIEFKEGMEINKGAASTYFIDGVERKLVSPLVAVIPKDLTTAEDVRSVLEESSQWQDNDLLIVCKSISGQALQTMVVNHTKGLVRSCAVSVSGASLRQHDILEDIAAVCGCEVLDPDMGYDFRNFNPEWFGSCLEINVQDKKTTFMAFEEAQESIMRRIEEIKNDMESSKSDYDRDRYQERIAKLSDGFCLVKVGGHTEAAMKEKRARIEDALGAVQSALRSGIVAGGGSVYLHTSNQLENSGGEGIVKRALLMPLRTLVRNAQQEDGYVYRHVLANSENAWTGWNLYKEEITNMYDLGVIDPLEVAVSAIKTSVGVSSLLITTECAII